MARRRSEMELAEVAGVQLEYELRGRGDPVVLVHAGVCADFFLPLADQADLTDRHLVMSYHRVGYGRSTRLSGPVSLRDQAAHCRALMEHLDIEQAHVVGHSSGACIALQLALDAPARVGSLALLEAARPAAPSAIQAELVSTVVEPALARFRAGDEAAAVESWMRGVCGPDYRQPVERALPPGALDEAAADADTFFGQELPAVIEWSFDAEVARKITQPALAVLGSESIAVFRERRDLLLAWLPNAEAYVLPEATHLLHVEHPRPLAQALAAFFARHPLEAAAETGPRTRTPT